MRIKVIIVGLLFTVNAAASNPEKLPELPLTVGVFEQQVHQPYTEAEGLPDKDVTGLRLGAEARVIAFTAQGTAVFDGIQWRKKPGRAEARPSAMRRHKQVARRLHRVTGTEVSIRAVAEQGDEIAVAADTGLYLSTGSGWTQVFPRQGEVRWAPVDVRAVAYDATGALWFASPQGVGRRVSDEDWVLFTGADGLPFNDFTCMAAGPRDVWFGTTNGAIRYSDGAWSFRQGRRWLLDNHVRDIVVDPSGNAWIATKAGVSCIAVQPFTLAAKASFFEDEIERYHRRTNLGYVSPAVLETPGDKTTAVPVFTDNDGHNTGLYLGAMALGYTATGREKLKEDAHQAFRALAFLNEVTEGGTHPAPKGFIARAVVPISEPDPNPEFDLAYDQRRNARDALWKIIQPRWPVDESGGWYWKNDSSSDELDGHFLGYALYYDHVCETEAEKEAVREVVRRIMDHILEHGYSLVDHDGLPTRWARFSPDDLNRNEAWCDERGLNSFSILTYLSIAHHLTGDPRYRQVYLELALDHGYGMNGMTQPKCLPGPDSPGHQPDDNMAFMNYYHLVRYETDPKLLSMYYYAIHTHWQYEKYERNPFANFVYAACCEGKVRTDHWGDTDLSPPPSCYEDAVDTLKRFPLDLIDWSISNAHRTDLAQPRGYPGQEPGFRTRMDGFAYPIDERHEIYWAFDPWLLTYEGHGTRLREGVPYLLAYYMGLAHGFIAE